MAFLERHHAMVTKSRGTAPDRHVAMHHRYASYFVTSIQAAKQKDRWYSERYGNNRLRKIMLVFVLVQRQLCARLIAIDQARIGLEIRESCVSGPQSLRVFETIPASAASARPSPDRSRRNGNRFCLSPSRANRSWSSRLTYDNRRA